MCGLRGAERNSRLMLTLKGSGCIQHIDTSTLGTVNTSGSVQAVRTIRILLPTCLCPCNTARIRTPALFSSVSLQVFLIFAVDGRHFRSTVSPYLWGMSSSPHAHGGSVILHGLCSSIIIKFDQRLPTQLMLSCSRRLCDTRIK